MNLILGDCLEKLKDLPDNVIDTIITDPPYGLSFMGKKWDYDVPSEEVWRECLRVLKPGGTALIFGGSRTYHRMAVRVEDAGFVLKDCIMWLYGSGFPKATDISKQLDKGHERKVIGRKTGRAATPVSDIRGGKMHAGGTIAGAMDCSAITEPATPEAQLWNGWKSHGLKPAYEPIIVAMKPNEGTYANNALKHGVSGLNIDGGRISKHDGDRTEYGRDKELPNANNTNSLGKFKVNTPYREHSEGRFPANIILDEEVAKDEEWKRYFYCAKASKAERNAGCEGLEKKAGGSNAKGYTDDVAKGLDRNRPVSNHHPTVKPLKLMEYLCTLTKTPHGGIVLDPYMGSGSTGVACVNTGRYFVGIEREPEYIEIAEARIEHAQKVINL